VRGVVAAVDVLASPLLVMLGEPVVRVAVVNLNAGKACTQLSEAWVALTLVKAVVVVALVAKEDRQVTEMTMLE